MYNYLPTVAADYTAETLDITPYDPASILGKKRQEVFVFKDGSVAVIGISSQSYFDVFFEWKKLSDSEYTFLLDFWHNPLKANGFERTFQWLNPVDNATYAARFMSKLQIEYDQIGNIRSQRVHLRVEGLVSESPPPAGGFPYSFPFTLG